MKTTILLLAFITAAISGLSQVQNAPDQRTMTLRQRFEWLKSNSETYGEYKVIKEHLLDLAWTVVNDSVQRARNVVRFTKDSLRNLRRELADIQQILIAKEKSLEPLEYAGSHMVAMGIPFTKNAFMAAVLISIGLLMTGMALLITRMKQTQLLMSEKSEMLTLMTSEYEDYKKRSLERQMKLSRELQSERNRHLEQHRV